VNSQTPFTKQTILEALADAERDTAVFFDSLTPGEWSQRVASAWTPAEHLDHLNIACSAVARGFAMPRLLLRIRFGRARRGKIAIAQVTTGM
jgi:hypothetical protein